MNGIQKRRFRKIMRSIPGYDPWETAEPGQWFDDDLASLAIDFFPECLCHVEGALAGVPFHLEDWQKAIVGNLWGWRQKDAAGRDVRRYREVLLYVPRKNGKALALDTPIPTATGWKNMGDVRVGDTLFDADGKPTQVVAAFDTLYDHPCYRVIFSDGESIVCDAEHLWETDSRRDRDRMRGRRCDDRPRPSVKTTQDIAKTLERNPNNSRVEWNHRIAIAKCLHAEYANLPLHPYILGVWLGDGDSDAARLTCDRNDCQLLQEVERCGVQVTHQRDDPRSNASRYLLGSGSRRYSERRTSVQASLRALGLLKNKHIPSQYLRASSPQRLALLQGLMDTDGYCSASGQCEFTTTKPRLRDDAMELLRTLGYKPTLKTCRATIRGRDCGENYRIQFWAFADRPVFRLDRKKDRLKPKPERTTRSSYRHVVAVEPVDSVPVRCIAVDNPRKLYLAGKGFIPTHNTPLSAGIGLAVFTLDREEGQQDYIAAADRDQAGMLFRQCSGMVERSSELAGMYRIYGGHGGGASQSKSIVKRNEPQSFLRVISADASTKHGGTSHLVLIDELHAQKNRELVDVMRTSMASANRIQPLLVYLTTADYERESICNEVHDHACGVRDGTIKDSRFLPVIYEVKETDPWDKEKTWRRANPNFGVSVSEEYLRREVELAKKIPARLNEFLRLHLNVRTKARTRWLNPADWAACGEPFDPAELVGEGCIAGLDIGISSDLSAAALVFPRDNRFDVLMRFWVSRKAAADAERMYGIPYSAWARDGHITLTESGDNNIDTIVSEFRENECKTYDVRELVYDPWNFEAMAGKLANDGMIVVKCPMNMHNLNEPTKALEELIAKRQIRHGGHPVLSWCAENAEVVRDNNDNIRPVKPEGADHLKIDGIMAVVMGLYRAMRQVEFVSMYETLETVVV